MPLREHPQTEMEGKKKKKNIPWQIAKNLIPCSFLTGVWTCDRMWAGWYYPKPHMSVKVVEIREQKVSADEKCASCNAQECFEVGQKRGGTSQAWFCLLSCKLSPSCCPTGSQRADIGQKDQKMWCQKCFVFNRQSATDCQHAVWLAIQMHQIQLPCPLLLRRNCRYI